MFPRVKFVIIIYYLSKDIKIKSLPLKRYIQLDRQRKRGLGS